MDACFALIMLDLVIVSTLPRDRLRRTSPKWPILYHAGHKTLTQSICVGRSEQMGLCFYIGRRKWRNSILHEGSRHCDAQCRSVQRLDGWRSELPYVVIPSTRSSLFLLRLGVLCLCIFCVRWMKNEVMWLMIHGWWKCFDPGARLRLTVGCLSGSTSRSNCRVECKLSKWLRGRIMGVGRIFHQFKAVQSTVVIVLIFCCSDLQCFSVGQTIPKNCPFPWGDMGAPIWYMVPWASPCLPYKKIMYAACTEKKTFLYSNPETNNLAVVVVVFIC